MDGSPLIPTASMEMWLKADTIMGLADNTAIANWMDSSNPTDLASKAFAAIGYGPTYQTAEVNGYPAVDFNGSSHYFTSSATSSAAAQTIFAVVNVDSVTGYRSIVGAGSAGGLQLQLDAGKPTLVKQDTQLILATSTALTVGAWYYITAKYDESTDAVLIRVNGTETTGTYTGALTAGLNTFVGRQYSGEYLDGRIAEVIKYSSALSTGDVTTVENYLKAKYGL
jgi:hypothetical protein